jgi:hypothetical protein
MIKNIGTKLSSKQIKNIIKSEVVKNKISIICKIHIKQLNSHGLYGFSKLENKQIHIKNVVNIKKNNEIEFKPKSIAQ